MASSGSSDGSSLAPGVDISIAASAGGSSGSASVSGISAVVTTAICVRADVVFTSPTPLRGGGQPHVIDTPTARRKSRLAPPVINGLQASGVTFGCL